MSRFLNVVSAQLGVSSALAGVGRRVSATQDALEARLRFYDHDYGVELGSVNEHRLRHASRTDAIRLIGEACREPTSIEFLYYAQVGGPHVRGEA